MSSADDILNASDPFDLRRFVSAQEPVYHAVLEELRGGKKRTHWMWFIFPQFVGLGYSPTSKLYAIKSSEEAHHYLSHPVLSPRLTECAETVLAIKGRTALDVFGSPDDMKLKSSMTLFGACAQPNSVFVHVLDKYFDGKRDARTLDLLKQSKAK